MPQFIDDAPQQSTPGPKFIDDSSSNQPWRDAGTPAPAGPVPPPPTPHAGYFTRHAGNQSIFSNINPLLGAVMQGINSATNGSSINPTNAGVVHGAVNDVVGPTQSLAHISGIGVPQTDALAQNTSDYFGNNFNKDASGEAMGSIAPFLMSGGSVGGNGVLSGAQRLGNVLKGVGIGGVAAPLLTPEANLNPNDPNDYSNRKKGEAVTGAALGGVMAALPEIYNAGRAGYQAGKNFFNPPIESSGAGTAGEVIGGSALGNPSIRELKRIVTENPITEGDTSATSLAADDLKNVTIAAAKEHGIDLSRGDITNDPLVRAQERGYQGRIGSGGNAFRQQQGQQINQAIGNVGSEVRQNFARQLMDSGSLSLDALEHPSATLQADMQNQYAQNLAIDRAKYGAIDTAIDGAVAKGGVNEVNLEPVKQQILDAIEKNRVSLSHDPELDTKLKALLYNVTNPGADTTIQGVKSAVSQLEGQVEGMKSGQSPNRFSAKVLQDIKTSMDGAADQAGKDLLGPDSHLIDDASDWHKNHVVPFRDSDSGLPQIINGTYPDSATKTFLNAATRDKFAALTDNLGDKGRSALHAQLLNAAQESATVNGKFDPQSWAAYLDKRHDELQHLLSPEDFTHLEGLIHVIQSAPDAGTVAKAPGLLEGGYRTAARTVGGLVGTPAGLPGMAVSTAIEGAGETALNAVQGQRLFHPNIVEKPPTPSVLPEGSTPQGSGSVPPPPPPGPKTTSMGEMAAPGPVAPGRATFQGEAGLQPQQRLEEYVNPMNRAYYGADDTRNSEYIMNQLDAIYATRKQLEAGEALKTPEGKNEYAMLGRARVAMEQELKKTLRMVTSNPEQIDTLGKMAYNASSHGEQARALGMMPTENQPIPETNLGQGNPMNAPGQPDTGLGNQPGFNMTRQKGQDLGAGEFDPLKQRLNNAFEALKSKFRGGEQAPEVQELNKLINIGKRLTPEEETAKAVAQTLSSKYNKINTTGGETVQDLLEDNSSNSPVVSDEAQKKMVDVGIQDYLKRYKPGAETLTDILHGQGALPAKMAPTPFSDADYTKLNPEDSYIVNGKLFTKPPKLKAPNSIPPVVSKPVSSTSLAGTAKMTPEEIEALLNLRPGRK